MPFEKSIQSRILNYLNTEVRHCIAENVSGNVGQRGRADINGCWNGRAFRIEVKSPDHGNKASQAQIINMKKWTRAGALCMIVYSLDNVKAVINNDMPI